MLDLLMRNHERLLLLSFSWQMAVTQEEISQGGEEKVRESSAVVSRVAL